MGAKVGGGELGHEFLAAVGLAAKIGAFGEGGAIQAGGVAGGVGELVEKGGIETLGAFEGGALGHVYAVGAGAVEAAAAAVFADGGCVWHAGHDALALLDGLEGACGWGGELGQAFALGNVKHVVVAQHGNDFVLAGGGVNVFAFEELPERDEVTFFTFADLAAELAGFVEGDEDGALVGEGAKKEPVQAAIGAAVPVAWGVVGGGPVFLPRADACAEAGNDALSDFFVDVTFGGGGDGGLCGGAHGVWWCVGVVVWVAVPVCGGLSFAATFDL